MFVCWFTYLPLSVVGVVLTRKLSKLPKNKCWFVGPSKENAADIACEFNKNWEMNLRVGKHDCRDYANGKNFLPLWLMIRMCINCLLRLIFLVGRN